jgi:hypothetical protein
MPFPGRLVVDWAKRSVPNVLAHVAHYSHSAYKVQLAPPPLSLWEKLLDNSQKPSRAIPLYSVHITALAKIEMPKNQPNSYIFQQFA